MTNDIKLPQNLPAIIIDDLFLYPFMIAPIFFEDEQNINSINYALEHDTPIVVVVKKSLNSNKIDNFYDVGVVGTIMRKVAMPNNKVKILFKGVGKCATTDIVKGSPLLLSVSHLEQKRYDKDRVYAMLKILKIAISKYSKLNKNFPVDLINTIDTHSEPNRTADLISSVLTIPIKSSYVLFKQTDIELRLVMLVEYINEQIEALKLQQTVQNEVNTKIHNTNEKYFIKEQIKNLQNKLDDGSHDKQKKQKKNLKKLKKLKSHMSVDGYKECKKIAQRLSRLHQDQPDTTLLETYLEYVFDIPFGRYSDKNISIDDIQTQLDRDHFGLETPKDRIVEFFAVKQLLKQNHNTRTKSGTIVCFVGPPGIGKTSLANSISKALGRSLVRIALGGLDDVNELRGHRRTYVGAMPGRIVQGLMRAKNMNPVVVLDEIDKIGRGHKGDPTSVMLEVLDPEQNSSFQDLYLNFDIDLSRCLFIATANTTSTIPPALRDRMEFVWLSSYTPLEKYNIAINYLIPQELKTHGMQGDTVHISPNCIKTIIDNYTRESGVRNLRRVFAKLFRKIARELLKENKPVQIGLTNIKKYLKKPIFKIEKAENTAKIGLVSGLAWTAVGGDTLTIEAAKIKGKGVLSLTGSLGEVMKESAKISHTVVKTIIDGEHNSTKTPIYNSYDIHIHIPSGATPKDGPSAGITMAVAIYSILKDVKVWQNIAMTGELSLKGDVLPIGGLKEKLIAAYKAGVKEVLIPYKNYQDDIDDIPKEVLQHIKISPVKTILEVMDKVFEK